MVIGWQAQFTMRGRLRLPSSNAAAATPSQPSTSEAPGLGGRNAASEKRNELYSAETISPNARHGHARIGLNGRRKSFHALAVLMFTPGIIVDVSF